jgi:tetratricopeptide (TPR) repeat protein
MSNNKKSVEMKCFGIIILFCICASSVKAQGVLRDVDSLKVRAETYENLKQYDKAVADYKRLTELEPDEEIFWYLLGRNQYNNRQLQDALKSLDNAIDLNSKYLPAFHTKIRVLLQLNQTDAALKVSNLTLNIAATAMNFFLQGEVYSKMKSWQQATWAYEQATKRDRGFIEAYIALSNIAANTNKAQEALIAAEAAIGIDPDSKEAMIAQSRGFALHQSYTDAIETVSEVLKIDPNNIDALYLRGTYYRDDNKPQEAISDFEQALKHQPDHWQAMAGRADGYAKAGNKNTALEGYRKLLEIAANYHEKDDIILLANQQIFELNRENRAPVLTLTDPTPENFDILAPDHLKSITVKGIITDESPIQSLVVNGQDIAVTPVGDDFEFAAVVNLENVQEILMEVSDIYNNMTKAPYRILRHETEKPQITLFTPKPSETGVITLTDNETTLYLEGKIIDESLIASIAVDGKAVDFDADAANPNFSEIVNITGKTRFSITATDCFGNTAQQTYTLQRITE